MNPLNFPAALCSDWIGPVAVNEVRPAIPSPVLANWRDLAARLRELDSRLAEADFDPQRVEALRRAIAEGRYVADPAGIADGLLRAVVPTRRTN